MAQPSDTEGLKGAALFIGQIKIHTIKLHTVQKMTGCIWNATEVIQGSRIPQLCPWAIWRIWKYTGNILTPPAMFLFLLAYNYCSCRAAAKSTVVLGSRVFSSPPRWIRGGGVIQFNFVLRQELPHGSTSSSCFLLANFPDKWGKGRALQSPESSARVSPDAIEAGNSSCSCFSTTEESLPP